MARTAHLALALLLVILAACSTRPADRPTGSLSGRATAGPVCPVEQVPPDPACAPRPVAGAIIVVRDPQGREVARATTDADGRYRLTLPAGEYVVEPQAIAAYPGPAESKPVTIAPGGSVTADVGYDTGIR